LHCQERNAGAAHQLRDYRVVEIEVARHQPTAVREHDGRSALPAGLLVPAQFKGRSVAIESPVSSGLDIGKGGHRMGPKRQVGVRNLANGAPVSADRPWWRGGSRRREGGGDLRIEDEAHA
jgi:hypothetical protein